MRAQGRDLEEPPDDAIGIPLALFGCPAPSGGHWIAPAASPRTRRATRAAVSRECSYLPGRAWDRWLPAARHDRRFGRQQSALGFVDGPRDGVEADVRCSIATEASAVSGHLGGASSARCICIPPRP